MHYFQHKISILTGQMTRISFFFYINAFSIAYLFFCFCVICIFLANSGWEGLKGKEGEGSQNIWIPYFL